MGSNENYRIEARSLPIPSGSPIAGHAFWVLRDPDGRVLSELHGLATDRSTGESFAIGLDEEKYSLRVWHMAHDAELAARSGENLDKTTYVADDQQSRRIFEGPKDEVFARWDAAVAAQKPLNDLDLDYPTLGFTIVGATVNSNSTFHTLGSVMGLPSPGLPGIVEPGIENTMIDSKALDRLRVKGYPVLREPSIYEDGHYIDLSTKSNEFLLRHSPDGAAAATPTPVVNLNPLANHPIYASIRSQLPDDVSDAKATEVALRAMQNGMQTPAEIRSVMVQDDRAFVAGSVPGFRASVDLAAPAPSNDTVAAQLQALNQSNDDRVATQAHSHGGRGPA